MKPKETEVAASCSVSGTPRINCDNGVDHKADIHHAVLKPRRLCRSTRRNSALVDVAMAR